MRETGAWARSSGAESQFDQIAAERRIAPLENVATAVRSILVEGPLHRKDIMARLNERGIYIDGESRSPT